MMATAQCFSFVIPCYPSTVILKKLLLVHNLDSSVVLELIMGIIQIFDVILKLCILIEFLLQ